MRRINRPLARLGIAALGTACCAISAGAQTTLTFQEGLNDYTGSLELFIGPDPADIPSGADGNVVGSTLPKDFMDGLYYERGTPPVTTGDPFQELQMLMRWENLFGSGPNLIPLGAKIKSASLTLTTGDGGNAQSNGPYGVSQIIAMDPDNPGMPWQFDTSDTWNTVSAMGGAGGATFAGGHVDRGLDNGFRGPMGASDGLQNPPAINKVTADITRMVQNWSNGAPNQGFVIRSGTTDGWEVFTSGAVQVLPTVPVDQLRPKLTVTYEPASTLPTTKTTLVQNVNGYTGTTMAWLRSGLPDGMGGFPGQLTSDGAELERQFLDGGNLAGDSPDDAALIKFDNIFVSQGGSIPNGATILDAQLIVDSADALLSANTGTNGNFGARQMLVDWSTTKLYTDFGGNGPDEAQSEVGPVLDTTGALIADSRTYLDVTQAVKNWQSGQSNFGLILEAIDTADGWAIQFLGSSTPPQLEITYTTAVVTTEDANFDNDSDVDGHDFLIWQRNVGVTTSATNEIGDANSDDAVNSADLEIWKGDFGPTAVSAAAGAVPEPASAALAGAIVAALAGLARRRRA